MSNKRTKVLEAAVLLVVVVAFGALLIVGFGGWD